MTRPTTRFVGIKSPEQQSAMMLHRDRLILNRQRAQLSNRMRAHLAESGIVASIGRNVLDQFRDMVANPADEGVPVDARFCLELLAVQLRIVKDRNSGFIARKQWRRIIQPSADGHVQASWWQAALQ